MASALKKMKYKGLLIVGFIWILLLNTIVSARSVESVESLPEILDSHCYQKECKAEKDLWDDINSKCLFTPKVWYYEEYFERNGEKKAKAQELESFLSGKLSSADLILLNFVQNPSFASQLSAEERKAFLEFRCSKAGLIFESEKCDESFTNNYLLMIDEDILKLDLPLDKKNKIAELYSSCLVFASPEQLEEQKFLKNSFLSFLFIIGIIILGSWIYHIKEKNSFKYIVHAIFGFFIAFFHILLSLSIFSFLIRGFLFPLGIFALLFIGGCVLEFVFYKKTKQLFLIYSLLFSILMLSYVVVLFFNSNEFFHWIEGIGARWG